MAERRVLVTGVNGFVGRTLVSQTRLEWPDAAIFGIDLTAPAVTAGQACDASDAVAVRDVVARLTPDVVFHCAGSVSGGELDVLVERLVTPTRVVLDAVAAEAPRAIVVVPGSAAEYGTLSAGRTAFSETDASEPASPYGVAKSLQTRATLDAARAGVDARVARIFNLIGPGVPETFLPGRVAASLAAIALGETSDNRLSLGPLDSVRDYVDIRDACSGMLAVASRGSAGDVYNLCSGVGRRARDVVSALVRASGVGAEVVEGDSGSPRTGLDVSIGDPTRTAERCRWTASVDFETSVRDGYAAALASHMP